MQNAFAALLDSDTEDEGDDAPAPRNETDSVRGPLPATETFSERSDWRSAAPRAAGRGSESGRSRAPEAEPEKMYAVDTGLLPVDFGHGMLAGAPQLGSGPPLNVEFYGRCFRCMYRSHSQKYCPLAHCRRCGNFGHVDAVCTAEDSR